MAGVGNSKRIAERDEEQPGSACFEVYKPFDPEVLDDELTAEMGWRRNAGLAIEGDPTEASEEAPVTVWVLRGDEVDTSAVKRVVTAHRRPEGNTGVTEWDILVAKAREGDDFTDEQMASALRALLLRAAGA
jgi:hypothetical protein